MRIAAGVREVDNPLLPVDAIKCPPIRQTSREPAFKLAPRDRSHGGTLIRYAVTANAG
jgi:hypothetical protein